MSGAFMSTKGICRHSSSTYNFVQEQENNQFWLPAYPAGSDHAQMIRCTHQIHMAMKQVFILSILIFLSVDFINAQTGALTGDHTFDKKWIRNGQSEMAYYVISNGQMIEICSFSIEVQSTAKTLNLYTSLKFLHSEESWTDTSIAEAGTLKPVYRSSYNKDRTYSLKYGKTVTGFYYDHKTGKRTGIQEPVSGFYLDSYIYPYLLGALPLEPGYKTDLAVYDYGPGGSSNLKKVKILEVKNGVYKSPHTDNHKVWLVTALEEASGDKYQYFIDKENRRIWKVEVFAKGQQLVLIDKELDYDPFTAKFNKAETLKLITEGSGVISGQAFARDNQAGIKGIAVLNINKRQYAQAGTGIVLLPYTDYFREWIELNETGRKSGKSFPLHKEAAGCIKVATVYDDEGHFEFVNLMPGKYLLYTEFSYIHKATRTEVVGYTDTYINGMFQGTTANTTSYDYNANASAAIKKIITIDKAGETVSVKLKKTR